MSAEETASEVAEAAAEEMDFEAPAAAAEEAVSEEPAAEESQAGETVSDIPDECHESDPVNTTEAEKQALSKTP